MKRIFVLITILMAGPGSAYATIVPISIPVSVHTSITPVDPLQYFSQLSMKEVQHIAGRKLKLKEKIAIKILQWKIRKGFRLNNEKLAKDPGKTAMIFGIIALPLLFIPLIGPFAALAAAILALVIGYSARKKNPDDKKARTGILLGWITIGLMVLLIAIIVAVLATWSLGGWG